MAHVRVAPTAPIAPPPHPLQHIAPYPSSTHLKQANDRKSDKSDGSIKILADLAEGPDEVWGGDSSEKVKSLDALDATNIIPDDTVGWYSW